MHQAKLHLHGREDGFKRLVKASEPIPTTQEDIPDSTGTFCPCGGR